MQHPLTNVDVQMYDQLRVTCAHVGGQMQSCQQRYEASPARTGCSDSWMCTGCCISMGTLANKDSMGTCSIKSCQSVLRHHLLGKAVQAVSSEFLER